MTIIHDYNTNLRQLTTLNPEAMVAQRLARLKAEQARVNPIIVGLRVKGESYSSRACSALSLASG